MWHEIPDEVSPSGLLYCTGCCGFAQSPTCVKLPKPITKKQRLPLKKELSPSHFLASGISGGRFWTRCFAVVWHEIPDEVSPFGLLYLAGCCGFAQSPTRLQCRNILPRNSGCPQSRSCPPAPFEPVGLLRGAIGQGGLQLCGMKVMTKCHQPVYYTVLVVVALNNSPSRP